MAREKENNVMALRRWRCSH